MLMAIPLQLLNGGRNFGSVFLRTETYSLRESRGIFSKPSTRSLTTSSRQPFISFRPTAIEPLRCDKGGRYRGDVVQRRADLLRPVPLHERVEEQHAPKEQRCHDEHRRQPAQRPKANGQERSHTP